MSDIIPKIIHELNNKNFKKALKLCEKYSENNDLHILNNLKGIIFINLKDNHFVWFLLSFFFHVFSLHKI